MPIVDNNKLRHERFCSSLRIDDDDWMAIFDFDHSFFVRTKKISFFTFDWIPQKKQQQATISERDRQYCHDGHFTTNFSKETQSHFAHMLRIFIIKMVF